MPAHKQVSKQPTGANKKPVGVIKQPAAVDKRHRPYNFQTGDIAMKAAFDHGVPFSNGMYTAVVIKNLNINVVHEVQFVRQLAVEDLGARSKRQTKK